MNEIEIFDICIIGGSIAGNYLGYLLQNSGLRIAIIEEHETIGKPLQCAGIVSMKLKSLIPIPEKIILNRVKRAKVATVYRVLMTLPWVIPLAASMPMWQQIYEPNFGYLNFVLKEYIGIPHPPAWLSDKFWYWPAFGVAAVWKGFGYYMLLFLIGLYNIPDEHYEVARLDGANWWQTLWYLELPSIRNIMLLFFVTNVGFLSLGVTEGLTFGQGPGDCWKTLALHAYDEAFTGSMRLGYGSAINLALGIGNLILVSLIFRFFKSEKA